MSNGRIRTRMRNRFAGTPKICEFEACRGKPLSAQNIPRLWLEVSERVGTGFQKEETPARSQRLAHTGFYFLTGYGNGLRGYWWLRTERRPPLRSEGDDRHLGDADNLSSWRVRSPLINASDGKIVTKPVRK